MKQHELVDQIALALVGWFLFKCLEPSGRGIVGPVQQVGPIGNTFSDDVKCLCETAPLNSFGPACEGWTWRRDASGRPVELRHRRGTACKQNVFKG